MVSQRAAENRCLTTDPLTAGGSFSKPLYSTLMLSLSLSLTLSNTQVGKQLGVHFENMLLTFPADIWDFFNSLCGCGMHSGEGRIGGGEGGDHCLLLPYILFEWIPDHLAAHCDTSCKDATPITVQPTTLCLCWTTFQKCRGNCSHKLSCKLLDYTTCQGQAFFHINMNFIYAFFPWKQPYKCYNVLLN